MAPRLTVATRPGLPGRGAHVKHDPGRGAAGGASGAHGVARAIRPLWTQIYLPNLLIATGQGAMLPILVYAAREVHGSSATGAVLVALNGLGTLVFDLPSGRIVARLGESRSAWLAVALLLVGLAGCLASRSIVELAVSVLVQAMGWALWSLVRLTHLSRAAPVLVRGRALSLFGGIMRAGNVLGPFAFIAIASRHDVRPAFAIYLVSVVVGFAWVVLARDRNDPAVHQRSEPVRPWHVIKKHRNGLAVAGTAVLAVSLLRGSRTAIVPLWAAHLGLNSQQAAMLFAFSSVIDLALFYPAGVISDRFGRRAVLLPCLILLSVGHLLIPLTSSFDTLFAASFVLALGNGMGAGIVMTLGADLTPSEGRPSFLAVWRGISDAGTTAGPLVDSAVVGLGPIALAGPVIAVLGLAATALAATRLREPEHLARQAQDPDPAASSS